MKLHRNQNAPLEMVKSHYPNMFRNDDALYQYRQRSVNLRSKFQSYHLDQKTNDVSCNSAMAFLKISQLKNYDSLSCKLVIIYHLIQERPLASLSIWFDPF